MNLSFTLNNQAVSSLNQSQIAQSHSSQSNGFNNEHKGYLVNSTSFGNQIAKSPTAAGIVTSRNRTQSFGAPFHLHQPFNFHTQGVQLTTQQDTNQLREEQPENLDSDEAAEDYEEMSEYSNSRKSTTNVTNKKFSLIKDAERDSQSTKPKEDLLAEIDQYTIAKNLFCLSDSQSHETYRSNVAVIKHRCKANLQLIANTFCLEMDYQCIDEQSQTQKIIIDFIDFKERHVNEVSNQKGPSNDHCLSKPQKGLQEKSLMYLSHIPINSTSSKIIREQHVDDLRRIGELQGYYSFEQLYNTVTEKFVNKIIDTECQKKTQMEEPSTLHNQQLLPSCSNQPLPCVPKQVLLIGDQDEQKECTKQKKQIPVKYVECFSPSKKQTNTNDKFHQLYRDSMVKRQKTQRTNELKELQRKFQQDQECTFTPKISSRPSNPTENPVNQRKRSPQHFYEDMMKFQQQIEQKVMNLRVQEELELQQRRESSQRRSLLSSRSRKDFFEKLHHQQLGSFKENSKNNSKDEIKTLKKTLSRTRNEIVQHLYSDHFVRDVKLKTLQQRSHLLNQMGNQDAIDLSRSKQVLAQKIAYQIKQVYSEMGLKDEEPLTLFHFVEVLTKLGYLQSFNDNESSILNEAWATLYHEQKDQESQDPGVSQRNLTLFLLAIDSIYFDQMSSYPSAPQLKKKWGYFVNDNFFVEDESEVQRMHFTFETLVKNKQQHWRLAKVGSMSSPSSTKDLVFSPSLNAKSQLMANQYLEKLHQALQTGTGDPAAQLKHEDLLLSKGKVQRQRREQLIASKENQKDADCTFSPSLRNSYQSSSSRNRKASDVYKVLYDQAGTKHRANKTSEQIEFEGSREECTFRPNLSHTSKRNSNVLSRLPKSPQQRTVNFKSLQNQGYTQRQKLSKDMSSNIQQNQRKILQTIQPNEIKKNQKESSHYANSYLSNQFQNNNELKNDLQMSSKLTQIQCNQSDGNLMADSQMSENNQINRRQSQVNRFKRATSKGLLASATQEK